MSKRGARTQNKMGFLETKRMRSAISLLYPLSRNPACTSNALKQKKSCVLHAYGSVPLINIQMLLLRASGRVVLVKNDGRVFLEVYTSCPPNP